MSKLAIKLKDAELAALLEAAGFDNPRKIRDASDKDLKAVEGVGQAALSKIRGKFPRGR
jgi:DNA integrity scanning protein DisA with diadenylate cyclase activity